VNRQLAEWRSLRHAVSGTSQVPAAHIRPGLLNKALLRLTPVLRSYACISPPALAPELRLTNGIISVLKDRHKSSLQSVHISMQEEGLNLGYVTAMIGVLGYGQLRSLALHGIKYDRYAESKVQHLLDRIASRCRGLKELHFDNVQSEATGTEGFGRTLDYRSVCLLPLLKVCTRLEALHLCGTLADISNEALVMMMMSLPNLRTLRGAHAKYTQGRIVPWPPEVQQFVAAGPFRAVLENGQLHFDLGLHIWQTFIHHYSTTLPRGRLDYHVDNWVHKPPREFTFVRQD